MRSNCEKNYYYRMVQAIRSICWDDKFSMALLGWRGFRCIIILMDPSINIWFQIKWNAAANTGLPAFCVLVITEASIGWEKKSRVVKVIATKKYKHQTCKTLQVKVTTSVNLLTFNLRRTDSLKNLLQVNFSRVWTRYKSPNLSLAC